MIRFFKNAFYIIRAFRALSRYEYLNAYEHLTKIKTNNNSFNVKVILFKSYTTYMMAKNEYSIILCQKALALLDSKIGLKKINIDEIEYLKKYAYLIMQKNYDFIENFDLSYKLKLKVKSIVYETNNIRKVFLRNYPIPEIHPIF